MKYKLLVIFGVIIGVIVIGAFIELLIIKYNGVSVPVPNIPRGPETFGSGHSQGQGQPLTYVVMGDSTAVAQGAAYDQGYARATARYLARDRVVRLQNVGVSGARAADVEQKQLPEAIRLKPDIVLIAVGANDVTHTLRLGSVGTDLRKIIDGLRAANPAVKIVVTGSPEMGAVPRFPQPARYLAKLRTAKVNRIVTKLAHDTGVTFAPIAADTGPTFAAHPELFAQDKFHPNAAGYKLWIPVIERAFNTLVW